MPKQRPARRFHKLKNWRRLYRPLDETTRERVAIALLVGPDSTAYGAVDAQAGFTRQWCRGCRASVAFHQCELITPRASVCAFAGVQTRRVRPYGTGVAGGVYQQSWPMHKICVWDPSLCVSPLLPGSVRTALSDGDGRRGRGRVGPFRWCSSVRSSVRQPRFRLGRRGGSRSPHRWRSSGGRRSDGGPARRSDRSLKRAAQRAHGACGVDCLAFSAPAA
jgi:hypothetical protein